MLCTCRLVRTPFGKISGYGENGYRVKEHLDSVRILYEKEDEWELYDSDKYQSLINNKEL